METFKFNFRDVLRAPRLAFSLQKMWIQLLGIASGYIAYLVLTYLSLLAAGGQLASTWAKYGLLPCLYISGEQYPWYSWLLYGLGCVALIAIWLISNTAVSRATYMVAKGNNFYTWREAYAFSFRKVSSVLLAPVSLAVLVGLMIVGALVVGLVGKIPYIGELGISLFTVLWFVAGLFVFFFVLMIAVSLLLVPSIIATTDEDAFEAIFQTFSISWNKPCKLIFYEALTVVLSVVSLGLFATVVKEAVFIMNGLLSAFMGADFINLANNGQGMLQSWLFLGQGLVEGIYRDFTHFLYFTNQFVLIPTADLPVTVVISSYLYALSLLFIGLWVLSYGLSTFSIGNTVLYIALRKQKDDENLLERKDKEEEEEDEAEKKAEGEEATEKKDKDEDDDSAVVEETKE
jgi:hypothetical protein